MISVTQKLWSTTTLPRQMTVGDGTGESMRRSFPPSGAARQELPPDIAARLLHCDAEVMILDKPAGIAVHAGPRGGASLEDWLPALRMGKRHLPQPAHRLDADTAGCLALGRTKPALARLGAIFAGGRAEKIYWAALRGTLPEREGMVDAPLHKISSAARGWRMEVHQDGHSARTSWRVLGVSGNLSWVELRPATGRTHQLRVHCAHLGCPILGDTLYGGGAGPMHLLARSLTLPLDPPIGATAPVPAHMRTALIACGWVAG